jgi:HAD superfamily hydrolase (TIGR01509 family)
VTWELVIFDCDGVLVDSEPISNRIMAEMLTELGRPTPIEECYEQLMGRTMASCLEIISGHLGRPAPAMFVEEFRARSTAAMERELTPVAGVVDALARIDLPVCVASSGGPEKMRTTLGITGLLERFEGRLFSAHQVARGKPHPDVFLYAAREMGFAPEACVVVEDTEVGVRAARAAGMSVLGYAALTEPARLAAAGARVFHRMAELAALIESPGEGRGGERL